MKITVEGGRQRRRFGRGYPFFAFLSRFLLFFAIAVATLFVLAFLAFFLILMPFFFLLDWLRPHQRTSPKRFMTFVWQNRPNFRRPEQPGSGGETP